MEVGDRGRDVEMMVEMMELVVVEWRCQRCDGGGSVG